MDSERYDKLVRRAFSTGVTGKEAFELELEAHADESAKARLEEMERDDARVLALRRELEPWYLSKPAAMAASAVLAAGLTLLIAGGSPQVEPANGLASTSVHYLETLRSGSAADLTSVRVTADQPWVTLVAYPAFDGFDAFEVRIDRHADGEPTAAALGAGPWTQVWSTRAGAGNRDSLAVNLRSALLVPGVYRMRVDGLTADSRATAALLHFRVAN